MYYDLLVLGIALCGVAVFLDWAMDYGQLLGCIRFRIARNCSTFTERRMIVEGIQQEQPAERIRAMDFVYWQIAGRRPWFKFFICRPCMLFWITTLAGLFGLGFGSFALVLGIAYFCHSLLP